MRQMAGRFTMGTLLKRCGCSTHESTKDYLVTAIQKTTIQKRDKLPFNRPIPAFFGLTFLITWLVWIPLIGPLQGLMTFDVPIWAIVLLIAGATGPSLAAILVSRWFGGEASVIDLFRDFTKWRVGAWPLIVVVIPIALFVLTILLNVLFGGDVPRLDFSRGFSLVGTLLLAYVVRFAIALPTGPLAEEMGWRGFALPHLQAKHSALTSSIIIGVAWSLWHLPMFWVPGVALAGGETILTAPMQIAWYTLGTIGKSIIFTWAYNNTKGSLFVDVLFHASINTTFNVFLPLFYPDASAQLIHRLSLLELGLTWALALGLVAVCGAATLTRTKRKVVHSFE